MEDQVIISGGMLLLIIAFFLRDFFISIKELKTKTESMEVKLGILENNQTHMDDKFEQLYEAVKDLTIEIKNLNIAINKKKDL